MSLGTESFEVDFGRKQMRPARHQVAFWHITTFRRAVQFGRYRGIADFGQPNAL
jgi:hypothetical protein